MSGQIRDTELTDRYPYLSPVMDTLERALASIANFNGGFGSIVLHVKDATVIDFDVSMRHFVKGQVNKRIA